ncbi:hypothetical protein ABC270_08215 [Curtobacterium sp. 1P10AnD]|uniref:hypothetical protein n=1 Tax=Curtobacterium sp. 1P10AnD TaxID=3132283 RepID=UPI00399F0B04
MTDDSTSGPVSVWLCWAAIAIASVCTLNLVLSGALLPFEVIGQVSFFGIIPAFFLALFLLLWVGRQGHRTVRRWAIAVGCVLAASPLLMISLVTARNTVLDLLR